jgi:hypothetical protein
LDRPSVALEAPVIIELQRAGVPESGTLAGGEKPEREPF